MNEDNCAGTSTGSSRLGACEVCAVTSAKYTCPKCEVKTCSLRCSKIHKTELKCDGNRDRTKYVPLNKFTNFDMLSDYRLLEEISSRIENNKRKFGRAPKPFEIRHDLPIHLVKLKNEAFKRKINYKFLPKHFVRHKNNSTRLHFKSNTIRWQIEWVFVNCEYLKLIDTDISENTCLKSAVQKYFVPQEDNVLNDRLQFYQAVGLNGVQLLLKAEEKGPSKFYPLDSSLSLKNCFSNKTIIEYPTIIVVMKEHIDAFSLLDSDDEENLGDHELNGSKNGNDIVNKILKSSKNDEHVNGTKKNFLFVDDDDISDE